MCLHPVAHMPAAHGARLGRTHASMLFPHVERGDAVDRRVHGIVQRGRQVPLLGQCRPQGHLACLKLLIGRADHGDGVAIGLDQRGIDPVQLGMLNRQQHIRPRFPGLYKLGDLVDETLQIDAHFMADPVQRRDGAVAFLVADPPELPGNHQGRRDQQSQSAREECVELRFTHSEFPSTQPLTRPPHMAVG